MARKSDADTVVNQTVNADATPKTKRKRKDGDLADVPDLDSAIVPLDKHISNELVRQRKKRTSDNEHRDLPVAPSASEQLVAVDDTTSTSPERKKKKKKRKEDRRGKQRDEPATSSTPIDPALTSLEKENTANSTAFLSAVVAAAASPVAQDHPQTVDYAHHGPPFDNTVYQNVPPGLEGPVVSFSGEDLARALQGLDVARLADALQVLGDAGTNVIPLPGQPNPGPSGVNNLHHLMQSRLAYDHGLGSQNPPITGDSGISNDHGQLPVSSSAILGQPSRNPVKTATARKVTPTSVPHIMNEDHAHLLANKWLSANKLNELTKTIGLEYKKGKFSTSEEILLKNAIETYRIRNGLSPEQLKELIFAKGQKSKDNAFWFEITAQVPLRPVVAVYHHVRRAFHPLKQQGKWMPAEDDVLRQAVVELGQSWEKVSERVGRMASDCRDRWRNHINNREGRIFGAWTKEEEEHLTQIVLELTTAQGRNPDLDVFWTQVAARMGNTRGRHQCRIKWTDSLNKTVKNDGQKPRWSQQDAYILVHKIASLNVNDDSEIDWKLLVDDDWNLWSAHTLQRRWMTLKRSVRGHEEMSHQEIMDILRVKKSHPPPPNPTPARSRVRSAREVPADATASDVAIEDTFPPTGATGLSDMPAVAFPGDPTDINQSQPQIGNFTQGESHPHPGPLEAVPTEAAGQGSKDDEHSGDSTSSSDSEDDSSHSD